MPRTDAGLRLLRRLVEYDGGHERTERANIEAIEAEAHAQGHAEALAAVRAALTSEDEIAHGEAWNENHGNGYGLGECAYDDEPWPCRTQRGIDKLLAAIDHLETT